MVGARNRGDRDRPLGAGRGRVTPRGRPGRRARGGRVRRDLREGVAGQRHPGVRAGEQRPGAGRDGPQRGELREAARPEGQPPDGRGHLRRALRLRGGAGGAAGDAGSPAHPEPGRVARFRPAQGPSLRRVLHLESGARLQHTARQDRPDRVGGPLEARVQGQGGAAGDRVDQRGVLRGHHGEGLRKRTLRRRRGLRIE